MIGSNSFWHASSPLCCERRAIWVTDTSLIPFFFLTSVENSTVLLLVLETAIDGQNLCSSHVRMPCDSQAPMRYQCPCSHNKWGVTQSQPWLLSPAPSFYRGLKYLHQLPSSLLDSCCKLYFKMKHWLNRLTIELNIYIWILMLCQTE